MRRLRVLLLLVSVGWLAGCSSARRVSFEFDSFGRQSGHVDAFLLFDRYAGPTFDTMIPPRGDWPSVASGANLGERINYREYIRDYQGRNANAQQQFRRDFISRRSGVISR